MPNHTFRTMKPYLLQPQTIRFAETRPHGCAAKENRKEKPRYNIIM